MIITILSAFRNSCHQIERYCEQMDGLQAALHKRGDSLRLILGYGDSSDGTGEALFEAASHRLVETLLLDVSHGGAHYGSIEHPQRFKQLAAVGNRLLGCVPEDSDVVGIVESDLIWDAGTITQLIGDLEHIPPPWGAVAPMVMHQTDPRLYQGNGPFFYDRFAFRRKGVKFTNEPPYHPDIEPDSDLIELDSAGSVLFMDGDLARQARFSEEDAIVGLCRDIYAHDGSIFLDVSVSVFHP